MKGSIRILVDSEDRIPKSVLLPLVEQSNLRLADTFISPHGEGRFSITIRNITADRAAEQFMGSRDVEEQIFKANDIRLVDIDIPDQDFCAAVIKESALIGLGTLRIFPAKRPDNYDPGHLLSAAGLVPYNSETMKGQKKRRNRPRRRGRGRGKGSKP